jgi:hypothetical protein
LVTGDSVRVGDDTVVEEKVRPRPSFRVGEGSGTLLAICGADVVTLVEG